MNKCAEAPTHPSLELGRLFAWFLHYLWVVQFFLWVIY